MRRFAARYRPDAGSALELGCGTGTNLAALAALGRLTGIDASTEMLAIAREKAPGARLVEADMTAFELGERFDVAFCVFDTLNHVPTFAGWRELFACVHRHLAPGGLFVFDVNTLAKLRGIATFAPWWSPAPGGWVIQSVDPPDAAGLARWNVWIVERLAGGGLSGVHEPIGELGVELERIEGELEPRFELLEREDESGVPPSARSERVLYAWRSR